MWADYFDSQGVLYGFFSAANAAALQRSEGEGIAAQQPASTQLGADSPEDFNRRDQQGFTELDDENQEVASDYSSESLPDVDYFSAEENVSDGMGDARTRILSAAELETWFLEMAPDLPGIIIPRFICALG